MLAEFYRARGGNVALIFALAAVPLVGAAGAAVDFAKVNDVKAQMQNSIDAAVLAGVTQPSADQISMAGKVFDLDFGGKYGTSATRSFTQNADGTLSGTASSSVPLSLLSVLFTTQIPVTVTALATPGKQTATRPAANRIGVSFIMGKTSIWNDRLFNSASVEIVRVVQQ